MIDQNDVVAEEKGFATLARNLSNSENDVSEQEKESESDSDMPALIVRKYLSDNDSEDSEDKLDDGKQNSENQDFMRGRLRGRSFEELCYDKMIRKQIFKKTEPFVEGDKTSMLALQVLLEDIEIKDQAAKKVTDYVISYGTKEKVAEKQEKDEAK
jgi:hypothetical protein